MKSGFVDLEACNLIPSTFIGNDNKSVYLSPVNLKTFSKLCASTHMKQKQKNTNT